MSHILVPPSHHPDIFQHPICPSSHLINWLERHLRRYGGLPSLGVFLYRPYPHGFYRIRHRGVLPLSTLCPTVPSFLRASGPLFRGTPQEPSLLLPSPLKYHSHSVSQSVPPLCTASHSPTPLFLRSPWQYQRLSCPVCQMGGDCI